MDRQIFRTPDGGQEEGEAHEELRQTLQRRNTRRNRTEGAMRSTSPPLPHENMGHDENFSSIQGASLSSLPTRSSSWESNSMGAAEDAESGPANVKDRRNYIDATTPTLVDEDEEEEEMVSLEHERLLRTSRGVVLAKDDSHLRRTPGASMMNSSATVEQQRIASLRRTPGATTMHRSALVTTAVAPAPVSAAGDSARVLGFGLTLSASVADNDQSSSNRRPGDEDDSFTSSSSSASTNLAERPPPQAAADRPPLAPNSAARDMHSYTPAGWALSKNPDLDVTHGAFSPDTMRLTEALDNLLHDDEDNAGESSGDLQKSGQQVFRGEVKNLPSDNQPSPRVMFSEPTPQEKSQKEANESWSNSYIFDNDGGNAVMTKTPKSASARHRRGSSAKRNKNVSGNNASRGRRGQAQAQNKEPLFRPQQPNQPLFHPPQPNQPLFHPQQPNPVQIRGSTGGNEVGVSGFFRESPGGHAENQYLPGDDEERSSPRPLLNFSGAFAPPSKFNMQNFRRPVASSVRGPKFEASVAAASSSQPDNEQTKQSGDDRQSATGADSGQSQPFTVQQVHHHHHYSGLPAGQTHSVNAQPFVPHHMPAPMSSHGASSEIHFHPHHPTMEYHNPMYGPPVGMAPNSAMVPPSIGPYSVDPSMSHSVGQQYLHMQSQQPHTPQFAPPAWPQMMPVQYDAAAAHRDAGWHGSTNTGWSAVNEFGYGLPPQGMMENAHRMGMSPSPTYAPSESELSAAMETLQFSSDYAHMHVANQMPAPSARQQVQDAASHRDFPAAYAHRLRVRSVDSLSPANVPVQGRSRKQSWDCSRDTQQVAKKESRQRKARRQNTHNRNKKASSPGNEKARTPDFTSQPCQRKKNPSSPKKKKQAKGRAPSPSESISSSKQKSQASKVGKKEGSTGDGGRPSPSDDPADIKRAELVESPATRLAFKDFYRRFRAKERSSFQEAEDFALQNLKDETLPEQVHWRVYLELADLAKRSNRFDEARQLYRQVCDIQPYASQGWLEYSKLEEECGHLNRCSKILHNGLAHCEFSENLLTRAIKLEEKMGNLGRARQLLARLKHVGIEKVWRTVLEGALLEARAGNDVMARRVLKYLMHHVPWYGPLYLEAYRLERDLGRPLDALAIVERGLNAIPRYGPLWFGAFRLCEFLDLADKAYDLPRTAAMLERATASISRELIWKVHLDAAQILERVAIQSTSENPGLSLNKQLTLCRKKFAMTVLICPPNLCWKVWLASGRMELSAGNTELARKLFLRAHEVVPEKGRAAALVECARLEEFVGDVELARAILCKTRCEVAADWKVWIESVLLEIRHGKHRRAMSLAKRALEIHPGTGRLWAALVQLRHMDGEETQYSSLKRALRAAPKSGEVWCEAARLHLNPLSRTFDLEKARRQLFFATKFTPQYGDSFLETLRLDLLDKWIAPIASSIWDALKAPLLTKANLDQMDGDEIDQFIARCVVNAVRTDIQSPEIEKSSTSSAKEMALHDRIIDPDLALSIRSRLESRACDQAADVSMLELSCANADPNYGLLWFHCRQSPTDTARMVLSRAKEKIIDEISSCAHVYIAAIVRRSGVVAAVRNELQKQTSAPNEAAPNVIAEGSDEWHKMLDAKLLACPSIDNMLFAMNTDDKTDLVLLESSMSGSNFVTGLIELNKYTPLENMPLHDRRKALFGSDTLLS